MRFGLFGSAQARRAGPDVDSGSGFKDFVEDNVVVEPPTAQKPHPPLWMGGGRPVSIKRVAEHGCNLLLDQFAPIEQIGERVALFKAECEARGRRFDPMSVAVTRSINVVTTA